MCTPIALGVAAIGTQVVGGIISANAAKEKGKSDAAYYRHLAGGAREQADYVLETAERQVKGLRATSKRQVDYLVSGAAHGATLTRRKGKRVLGAQRAGFAGAGLGAGSVTAMDVALDTLEREQQDEELIRYNANVAVFETNNRAAMDAQEATMQAEMTARGLINQAEGYEMGAASAQRAADTSVWAHIIGGAGSVARTGLEMAVYA